MTVDMSQFYQVFFEEAAEHLANMETLLLGLDVGAPDPENLNAIFRAAHSIKGGSATFGFSDMTEVTHILESLLDRIRNNELALRTEMVDVFLRAGDVLRGQLEAHQNGELADTEPAKAICAELSQLATGGGVSAAAPAAEPSPAPEAASSSATAFRIAFSPTGDLAERRLDMDSLAGELGKLGALELNEAGPPTWRYTLTTEQGEAAIRDLLDFVAQPEELTVEPISAEDSQGYGFFTDTPAPAEEDPGYGFFTDAPAPPAEDSQGYGFFEGAPGAAAPSEEEQGYGFFEDVPTPTPEAEATPAAPSASAAPSPAPKPAAPPKTDSKTASAAAASQGETSIRVSVEKVDHLINLVGELVITQAMLAQTASKIDPVAYEIIQGALNQLEHNTRDLQESVMSIRMMPMSFVFSRFPRVVRDLCSKLGKQVELKTVGEGTELDKGLIEKLSDPLTHLVRNSLDHGIEMPDQRLAAGKPAKGTVTLRASHQGGNIVIEVIDDGAGLNRERILAKAHERGISIADNAPDQDVWQLIFAPGFSTAAVVTDVSGRGVGMDVVKKNIVHGMGGRIEIDSALGVGTRITIRLPLTLAILDGMSIAVGGEIYIIPLTFIVESLKPNPDDIKTMSGGDGRVVHVRGEYVPLVPLYEVFGITPQFTEPQDGILVLVEAEGKKVALFVDELEGQHQVVIKSLETNFRKVPGISGATIMGDGKVALILDVSSLVRMSQGH